MFQLVNSLRKRRIKAAPEHLLDPQHGPFALQTRTSDRGRAVIAATRPGSRDRADLTMGYLLRRNAFDRTFLGADRRPRNGLDHFSGTLRIGNPFLVEIVRTYGLTADVFTGIDLAGIAAMHK